MQTGLCDSARLSLINIPSLSGVTRDQKDCQSICRMGAKFECAQVECGGQLLTCCRDSENSGSTANILACHVCTGWLLLFANRDRSSMFFGLHTLVLLFSWWHSSYPDPVKCLTLGKKALYLCTDRYKENPHPGG